MRFFGFAARLRLACAARARRMPDLFFCPPRMRQPVHRATAAAATPTPLCTPRVAAELEHRQHGPSPPPPWYTSNARNAHQGERFSSESHLGLYGRGSVGTEKCCAQLDCGMQRRLLLEDARQQSELMWFPRVDNWRACANLMNSSQGIPPGRGGVWVR